MEGNILPVSLLHNLLSDRFLPVCPSLSIPHCWWGFKQFFPSCFCGFVLFCCCGGIANRSSIICSFRYGRVQHEFQHDIAALPGYQKFINIFHTSDAIFKPLRPTWIRTTKPETASPVFVWGKKINKRSEKDRFKWAQIDRFFAGLIFHLYQRAKCWEKSKNCMCDLVLVHCRIHFAILCVCSVFLLKFLLAVSVLSLELWVENKRGKHNTQKMAERSYFLDSGFRLISKVFPFFFETLA